MPDIPGLAPGEVLVRGGAGRYGQSIHTAGHQLLADEPAAQGGGDTGPAPYELLLAALGACTAMTIRMYAERKGIALADVRVRLAHTKIHADDCRECETRGGKVDQIVREITLVGDLTAAERERLFEIANRCPVHRTLTGEIRIVSRLA